MAEEHRPESITQIIKDTTINVPIISSVSPIAKYSTKPNSAILKTISKFVISWMVNSSFQTAIIANWLAAAAAFRYREQQHPIPISDIS
jgi:hypothetical protein